jgi:hypothetical protein
MKHTRHFTALFAFAALLALAAGVLVADAGDGDSATAALAAPPTTEATLQQCGDGELTEVAAALGLSAAELAAAEARSCNCNVAADCTEKCPNVPAACATRPCPTSQYTGVCLYAAPCE